MRDNEKKFPIELLFFLIGFIGFQVIWNFIVVPLITR